jgi:hypothetical protein
MHAVEFPVTIRIKLGLYPQVVPNPQIGIVQGFNDLRFTVLDLGDLQLFIVGACVADKGEHNDGGCQCTLSAQTAVEDTPLHSHDVNPQSGCGQDPVYLLGLPQLVEARPPHFLQFVILTVIAEIRKRSAKRPTSTVAIACGRIGVDAVAYHFASSSSSSASSGSSSPPTGQIRRMSQHSIQINAAMATQKKKNCQ